MAEKIVRVGIIGTGQIGKIHIDRYQKVAGAQIAAVADVDEGEAKRVAAKFEIPAVYTDFRELLKRDDIEAVDVCVHNNLHRPIAEAAFEAGKHVYCEKPMAGSHADAKAMMEAARESGKLFHIQFEPMFTKEMRAARHIVDSGELGEIYHARSYGYRRRGRPFVDGYGTARFVQKEIAAGGAMYDMAVYRIANLLYLMGNPRPLRVSGKTYQKLHMDEKRRTESGFDVEELACALVRFENDISMDILESWAIHMNDFEGSFIAGSKGGIRLQPLSYHCYFADMCMDGTFNLDEANFRWHQLDPNESGYDSSSHHWIAALQGRVPLIPTARFALTIMLLSEGVYLSEKLGREVSVEEVEENSKSTALSL